MGRYAAVCIAVALLLAGCVGGQGGTATSPTTGDVGTTAVETTTATTAGTGTADDAGTTSDGETTASSGGTSTMNFYVSDEQNAMDDFAHLNVTISEVGVRRAGDGDANWTTHDVANRTVDLTRLRGANATRLGSFAIAGGTYETVFLHVSRVNGTLTNGEQVRVKLPSEKLQIHQTFEVGPNQTVDYVFDVSVFEAGRSGKYILKPVISESGTDKEIEDVDAKKGDDEGGDEKKGKKEKSDDGDEKENKDGEGEDEKQDDAALNATFVGDVTRGGNATVSVTHNGSAVANATVSVNGEVVGETDADGTLTFAVLDADELEVDIETENGSAELTHRFEKGGGNGDEDDA